jgi:acyl-CoA thioesterase FadM
MSDMVHIDRTFPDHPGLPSRAVRFFESSRIHWISSIGEELGGQAQADAFLRARGISFILKSMNVNFRKPVQYPDTVSLVVRLRPLGYW